MISYSGGPRVQKCRKSEAGTNLLTIVVEDGAAPLERSAPRSAPKESAQKKGTILTAIKRRKEKIVIEKGRKLLSINEGKIYF